MMEVTVKIKIKDQEIELSIDDLEVLRRKLDLLKDPCYHYYFKTWPQPVYPIAPYWNHPYSTPYMTWTTGGS